MTEVLRYLKPLLLTVGGIYLLLCLLIFLFQSRMIYFPSHFLAYNPANINLKYEDFRLNSNGKFIHGWYIENGKGRPTLLFCHGNAGNIGDRLESIRIFESLGLNVLIFDYQGYGKSEGSPGEGASYSDALTAYRYLVDDKKIDPARIIIFGRSLGASIAAWLAKTEKSAGLILESPFASVEQLGSEIYPYFPIKWLSRYDYSTLDYVRQAKCPKLIIHSQADDVIPFHHGKSVYNAALPPKQFLEITGDHNNGFLVSGHKYLNGIRTFLSSISQSE